MKILSLAVTPIYDGTKQTFLKKLGKHVHLWSLEMPTKNVQVLEHLLYTKIPEDNSDVANILGLGNLMWKLSVG